MQEATIQDVTNPTEVEMADLTETVGLDISLDEKWTFATEHYVYTGEE
jgi:hypothetical protein